MKSVNLHYTSCVVVDGGRGSSASALGCMCCIERKDHPVLAVDKACLTLYILYMFYILLQIIASERIPDHMAVFEIRF